MQLSLMIALCFHIVPATFWAGTTFALARMPDGRGERLFRAQMGSAAVTVLAGAYLWHALHEGSFGPMEQWLSAGAVCALLALAVQAVGAGGVLGKLRAEDSTARGRFVWAQRLAAFLLVMATACMAAARYA